VSFADLSDGGPVLEVMLIRSILTVGTDCNFKDKPMERKRRREASAR